MKAVVVGGGLLGAELAGGVATLRHDVTFLVREPWYFLKGIQRTTGRIVEGAIRRARLRCSPLRTRSPSFVAIVSCGVLSPIRQGVRRGNGQGATMGVNPTSALPVQSGIATSRGILVDPALRTSRHECICRRRDCAEIRWADARPPEVEQLWYSADKQGRAVARSMCGDPRPYDPGIFFNSAMFFDVHYALSVRGAIRITARTRRPLYLAVDWLPGGCAQKRHCDGHNLRRSK